MLALVPAIIPHPDSFHFINTALPVGEHATVLGELLRGLESFVGDDTHGLPGHVHGFVGIIGDSKTDEHFGKTHHPKADLSVAQGHLFDFRQGMFVDFDNVIKKAHRLAGSCPELFPIHKSVTFFCARLIDPKLQDS